ncbi:hypothetical protein [Erythrobacter sp.]|jgi:hypothetical protein|uniref:hypothetical protein n=1 Tax=Erythrobacter sp. TaxID=1042 RepID=UPI002EB79E74|nr:hypothetical protein [Erythrobacter sp.]
MLAAGAGAQETPPDNEAAAAAKPSEQAPAPRERQVIDLTITVPREEADRLLVEDCERENEVAKIRGEIVVCRRRGEGSDGVWNKEDWEARYAARTQGEQPVNVAGGGIFRGPATVGGLCVIPPCPGEAALLIDVEALPEAPPGSDADRIARGLPPSGENGEPTPEEIARRRRAMGLEAPDPPGQ